MRESLILLFGEKGKECCEKVLSFHNRFPTLFPQTTLRELACFLSQCPDSFLENRDYAARIFFSLHHASLKNVQRLYTRAFAITSNLMGVAISCSSSEKHNEEQIFKSIQNLVTGIIPVSHSYFSYRSHTKTLYYLEIKKVRGSGFTKTEKKMLHAHLAADLCKSSESLSHSFFLPGNEEELIKNIRNLTHELKYLRDLPQVMITFVEYSQEILKFLVIVARVLKPDSQSLSNLSSSLPSLVQFSLEKVLNVGKLRNKYPKEVAIFTLEVSSSLFLNLRTARNYIVKAIESMLGPFRDYNGGLLNKENELLYAIKRELEAKNAYCPFLEDLFYGIKPFEMRALFNVDTGVELALYLVKLLEKPLENGEKYARFFSKNPKVHLALLKTQEKKWRSALPARVFSVCAEIGCSVLERDEFLYLCFFHQMPQSELLFSILEEELAKDKTSHASRQKTLRINFQSGDPLSLNPRLAIDMPSHILSNLLFEGLTESDGLRPAKPAAAHKIDISEDGMQYIFHLRPSWWSNGEQVSAYHFEKAWRRALSAPNTALQLPDFSLQIQDAKTLCVTLKAPCPYFLDLVSTPPFFPRLDEGEEPSHFNGPFTVAEWKRGDSLSLSQNPFYHAAHQIKLGGIKISMIQDPRIAYELFQKGELDFIGDPISPLTPELLIKQTHLIQKQIARVFWIHCNLDTFPLNNRCFRRALNVALNRKRLVENVFIKQIPLCSPFPLKYAQVLDGEEGDQALAGSYLEQAMQQLQVKKLPPIMMTQSDLAFEKPLFEELRQQWKEVLGIELVAHRLRWNEFSAALEKGQFQLCGLFRRDFFNHPLFYLNFFKPELLKHFEENQDQETLKQIERLLIEESPVIPLVNQKFLALVAPHVEGITWNENGCLNLKEVSINEAEC